MSRKRFLKIKKHYKMKIRDNKKQIRDLESRICFKSNKTDDIMVIMECNDTINHCNFILKKIGCIQLINKIVNTYDYYKKMEEDND